MAAWALDQYTQQTLAPVHAASSTEELWRCHPPNRPKPRCDARGSASWPKHDGLDERQGRKPNRLADRPCHRDPLGARRDEHPGSTPIPVVLAARRPNQARAGRWRSSPSGSRASPISFADAPPQGSVQLLIRGEVAALPLKGVIDFAAERARLHKEMQKAEADIKRVDAKLGNPKFVANAPRRSSKASARSARRPGRRQKIVEALERLQSAK
jgi:valyl-tRNA synthetase